MNYFFVISIILNSISWLPNLGWISLFAFVPIWWQWQKSNSFPEVLTTAFLFQFTSGLVSCYWMPSAVAEFGSISFQKSVFYWIILSSVANIHICISAVIWYFLTKKLKINGYKKIFLLVILTAIFESSFVKISPWESGMMWIWLRLSGSYNAQWIGVEGLSLILLLVNGLILSALMIYKYKRKKSFVLMIIAGMLLLTTNICGIYIKNAKKNYDSSLSALVIQPNIPNYARKNDYKAHVREAIVNKLIRQTKNNFTQSKKIDLITWPEIAVPFPMDKTYSGGTNQKKIHRMVKELNTPLILGAYSRDRLTSKLYNALFLIEPNGKVQVYRKNNLLPFAEKIPFSDSFPVFNQLINFGQKLSSSSNKNLIKFKNLKIAPTICYEGILKGHTLDYIKRGANFIINISNDSWFGNTIWIKQHLILTIARTIEIGAPVIRSSNSGITFSMDSNGIIKDQIPFNKAGAKIYKVPYSKKPALSFYAQFTWLVFVLKIIIFLTMIYYSAVRAISVGEKMRK